MDGHRKSKAWVERCLPLDTRTLETRAVAEPLKHPLSTSIGSASEAPLPLLHLETDGGIVQRSYLFGIGKHNLPPIADPALAAIYLSALASCEPSSHANLPVMRQ